MVFFRGLMLRPNGMEEAVGHQRPHINAVSHSLIFSLSLRSSAVKAQYNKSTMSVERELSGDSFIAKHHSTSYDYVS